MSAALVIEGNPRDVGTITVARLLPTLQRRRVGPFVFLDHMGPVEIPPGAGFDVRPHPHIGLSTVTYFLAGENVHRDSLGTVVTNRPGDVNVMTAGRGVVHSERAPDDVRARGGLLHGVQIWLALPEANEDDPPSFAHHPAATLPAIAPAAGVTGRVLIGAAYGHASPIRHPSAPLLIDLALAAGAEVHLPTAPELAVFVIAGEVAIGEAVAPAHHLVVLPDEAAHVLRATAAARVLVLGGPAIGERHLDWNFVASSRERLARARAAWAALDPTQFPPIPTDPDAPIPYPDLHGGHR